MLEFDYQALDSAARRQQGVLRAGSQQDALAQLHDRQLRVVSIRPRRASATSRGSSASAAKAGVEDVGTLIQELATLLDAGVALAEALGTLGQGQPADQALPRMLASIRGGGAFSAALAASGLKLPEYVLQLVRAGEATGHLADALRAAAAHLEAEAEFGREARNALLYPMVLVGSGILATLVMFIFVVPRFATILDNPKADIPMISQWVLGLGLWLTQHQLVVGLSVGGLAVLIAWAARRDDVRAAAWEMAARLPVLGRWAWHAELARWASLFAVLLRSKVPMLTALSQSNETFRRQRLQAQGRQVLADVRGGKALSQALMDHALLDNAGLNLIRVGERAGTLAHMVESLAKIHARHSQNRLKRFLVLLEPMTILVISVVLGGIMISVMLAITSLTNVL